MAVGGGLSLLVAWVSWHVWEKPFLGLKRYFEYAPASASKPSSSATPMETEPEAA
jgi:peptidoglycan/LPS O-acetylase OafA/YrhL